jgi:enoyl-CoA hydratase/carnithine racemase
MSLPPSSEFLGVELIGAVAVLEMRRPPLNFFDSELIGRIVDTLRALDEMPQCGAVVLAAAGKTFCAGADFGGDKPAEDGAEFVSFAGTLYQRAIGIFETRKPIVAAVHGAAIGGGLGLALAADFRVTCESARFSANFARLGIHCGFGISVTLPRLVGINQAATLLYTGRRISGAQALQIGLADQLVPADQVRSAAIAFAAEMAACAPLAVADMRQTLRRGLADQVREVLQRELACQNVHMRSADFREGVRATAERREPRFTGQ